MDNRKLGIIAGSLAVAAAVAVAVASCSGQAPTKCAALSGYFGARYTLVSKSGQMCGSIKGEKLGIQGYNPPLADNNPDYDHAIVGIQPDTLTALLNGGRTDPDPARKPYSLGGFLKTEPTNGICDMAPLTVADQQFAAIPSMSDGDGGTIDGVPATSVKYTWSNVKVYVSAGSTGTRITGNVEVSTDGCTVDYAVNALQLFNTLSCAVPTTLEDGGAGAPIASDAICDPKPNFDGGNPVGSGIDPRYPVVCDPDLLICLPATP